MKFHPDDMHALVLNRILSLPKFSPESHAAHRVYQDTRLLVIRPKLVAQKRLLEQALCSSSPCDAKVLALDDEIAAAWWRVNDAIGGLPAEVC